MNWLDNLLLQHSELESPISFWKWSALAAISAVVKDNIWFDKHLYKLYPNIYVMLHADSGLKKGPPVSMAKQLVRIVNNTNIISGRSSIQGILKEMGTSQSVPGGNVISKANSFICSSELSSSIVDDKAAMDILTDLYDRHYNEGDWKSLLKMESFSLKNATVTMLTATNEAHSEGFFLKKDIQGGYFARTFIIYENKRNTINSLMFPLKYKIDYKESAAYLKELSKLRGELVASDEVRHYFDDWYQDFIKTIDLQQVKDPTGTLNRFDDSALKVAMLLSLARNPVLELTMESVKEAIIECEKLIGNVRRTTMGQGKHAFAQEKALLIDELIRREPHIISRQMLNKKYYMRASANEWDEIALSLEVAGIISIQAQGNAVMYVMSDVMVKEWKSHLEGKNK
jgi:hypothetical protein